MNVMNVMKTLGRGMAALAIAAGAIPAGATTLVRAGLENLVATNGTIVLGDVVDVHSRWNDDKTFILTDVQVAPREVLKGDQSDRELTVTLMGGTVDGLTTLIVGGAELVPGRSYVLFLDEQDLPGLRRANTVRDHCQGVFDIVSGKDGQDARAISQAVFHPLLPDRLGRADAPGGVDGFSLQALKDSIRNIAGAQTGPVR